MSELLSLEDLFNKKIFRIPDYQRGYSWQDKQLIEFLEDIINLPVDRKHYTGMISLKKIKNIENKENEKWNDEHWLINNKGYNIYHIVDGQQRLTTCIILINEIAKFIISLPENKNKDIRDIILNSTRLSEIIEKYLVTTKPGSEEQLKTYIFGYEVDNPSYEFFKYRILKEESKENIIETFYTLNLENAKKFFDKAIKDINKEKGIKEIEQLFIKVTQRLQFNLYDIEDDFNTFMAFETMNNRGKKLSNLELLKNRLIYLTTLFKKPKDEEKKLRERINETWKIIYEYLGKNKQNPLDDDEFLQAHWIIYFGYSRNKGHNYENDLLNKIFTQKRIYNLYTDLESENGEKENEIDLDNDEIDDTIEEKRNNQKKLTITEISEYIKSLEKLIPFWYEMYFPDITEDMEIKEYLTKLNRLGWANFKPLTAVVLSRKDISKNNKIEYLKLIERFIFIYYRLCGYQSNSLNSYHYRLANELYYNKKTIENILDDLKDIEVLSRNSILPVNQIITNLEKHFKSGKGYYSWPSLRYVLYEYEIFLMDDQANQKIYPENLFRKTKKNDKVSIEHIYPQNDEDPYWQERFNGYSKEEKKYLSGTLGNLLPLSMSINSSLQNQSFDKKKNREPRGYKNGSHSEMEVAKNEEWTAYEILNRGMKLLEFMENRWDFKFKNEHEKYKVLFLDFLYSDKLEDEEEIEEIIEEIIEPKKKITREMVEYLYKEFKEGEKGRITIEEARERVVKEKGMNSSSAIMYLAALQSMINGKGYKRRIADGDVEFFLEMIKKDFGSEAFENSIKSVEAWIEYAKKHNMNPVKCKEIIKRFKNNN